MPVGPDGFRLPSINQSENKNKIECLPGEQEDKFCKTFVIHGEGHTLGNALHHIIVNYPEVTFCGYTVPHPMEGKIHFRIQCLKKPAAEILRKGLKDLKEQNEEVLKQIQNEIKNYGRESS